MSESNEGTSIRVRSETKALLDQHKVIEEEPYDKVVRRLAVLATDLENNLDDEGMLRPEYVQHLRARLRLRSQDHVVSHDSVVQRLKERQDSAAQGVRQGRKEQHGGNT